MENETRFGGFDVVVFEAGASLQDPDRTAYRVSVEFESAVPWVDHFDAFLGCAGVERVPALLVGAWGDVATGEAPDAIVEAVVGARARLPALRALFFGDIALEEAEISWIHQGDLSPLLSAYPELEELQVRGGQGLSLGKISHSSLKRLVIETGGMDRSIVQQVGTAHLPALEHLELWLGDDNYGANTSPADLAPILEGDLFPKLTSLGLRNCQYADALAAALGAAKVVGKIRSLDLSLGNLSDEGAESLLASSSIRKLTKLDLHHHYLSDAMMARLRAMGPEVDLEEQEEGEEGDRYVAVGE